MDKKNTVIGVLLLAAGIFLMSHQAKEAQRAADEQRALEELQQAQSKEVEESADEAIEKLDATEAEQSGGSVFASTAEGKTTFSPSLTQKSEEEEQTYLLKNDFIEVTFTSKGGAIKSVAFIDETSDGRLKYPATLDSTEPYVFGAGSDIPALAISLDSDEDGRPEEVAPHYEVDQVDREERRIQFIYKDPSGLAVVRAYKLPGPQDDSDPYLIQHETYFVNTGDQSFPLKALYINAGTAPPTKGDVTKEFLNFGYYVNGDADFLKMTKFTGSNGFLGIGRSSPNEYIYESKQQLEGSVTWASIKNQFFASVLTPQGVQGTGIFARPVDLSATIEDPDLQKGVTGAMEFNLGKVPAGDRKSIQASFYVGPKEYFRLNTLGQDQDKIMQFGFFGGISKLLLWALVSLHGVIVPLAPTWGWGFAIILLTCIIKGILWPLTQVQVKSAKRMATIQEPMKAIQEKFKDNPTKLQQEMAKLFKENKVNPAAGCLPILLQIPIFFALFYMLRTSSDLRYAPFLWIEDLSVPDTLPFLPDWFHLMPILMGLAMFFQMRMTPTPTTDNMQRKLFQFMPFIFLAFCYRFPSGLVLYWTVQNCISILQQWITNRSREETPAVEVTSAPAPAKKAAKTQGGGTPKSGKKKRK
ncbi:MAG: membrane protein insertase YidC [Verrucomicrobiota bacterium]